MSSILLALLPIMYCSNSLTQAKTVSAFPSITGSPQPTIPHLTSQLTNDSNYATLTEASADATALAIALG